MTVSERFGKCSQFTGSVHRMHQNGCDARSGNLLAHRGGGAGRINPATAEDANITASALNRRPARFESEFGAPIFERLPRDVRLNPAGELILQHYRAQRSDLARVKSHVADLAGVRRGHVAIACSQALILFFLPGQISAYRRAHPGVTFSVNVCDREQAEAELVTFRSDLARVFAPLVMVDFTVLHAVPRTVAAVPPPRIIRWPRSRRYACGTV